MVNQALTLLQKALRVTHQMDTQHWVIVAVIAVFAGFICLRGFSSQLN